MARPSFANPGFTGSWRWAGIFLLVSALLGLGLMIVPVYWLIAIIIGVIVLTYLALNPDKAFLLTIFTIPFVDRVRVLPISFSLNELILLFTFLVCVAHMILRSQKISFKTGLDGWIGVLTITFFLAGFFSESDTGLLGFFKVFEAFIVYYMTVYLLRTKQITRATILKAILFTAVFQAALGIFQSFTGIGSNFQSSRGYLGYLGLGSNRVWHGRGTTWHFNSLGNYLVTNVAVFLPLYLFSVKDKKRALIYAGILLFGIITTYSRGSLLGLAATVIYFLAVSQKTLKRALFFVAAFILCCIVPAVTTLGNTSYVETLSYNERLFIWQVPIAAITSSAKALWLGSGLNSYAVVAWPYIPAWVPESQFSNWFAHNFYLLTILEMGVIGASVLFIFMIYICVDTWVKFKRYHGYMSAYSLALSSCMIAIFFVSIFDHTFGSPHYKVFIFLLLALLYTKWQPRQSARH
ncbi:MAG: O-Antigen ligase [Vampirovibrio sp.]|jgi:hypothetical protein|nr:O-Antigen ligase [Vampirovibrio sp.]